jgi:hypothetical protein
MNVDNIFLCSLSDVRSLFLFHLNSIILEILLTLLRRGVACLEDEQCRGKLLSAWWNVFSCNRHGWVRAGSLILKLTVTSPTWWYITPPMTCPPVFASKKLPSTNPFALGAPPLAHWEPQRLRRWNAPESLLASVLPEAFARVFPHLIAFSKGVEEFSSYCHRCM